MFQRRNVSLKRITLQSQNAACETVRMARSSRSNKAHTADPKTSDDVVWGNVNKDDDGGLTLAPLDPKEEQPPGEASEAMLRAEAALRGEAPSLDDYPRPQFTLKHMVIAQAVIAVLLGLIRAFAPQMMAGSLGIIAMLFAAVISILEPEDRRVTIAFWCVMFLYVMACVIAVMLGN